MIGGTDFASERKETGSGSGPDATSSGLPTSPVEVNWVSWFGPSTIPEPRSDLPKSDLRRSKQQSGLSSVPRQNGCSFGGGQHHNSSSRRVGGVPAAMRVPPPSRAGRDFFGCWVEVRERLLAPAMRRRSERPRRQSCRDATSARGRPRRGNRLRQTLTAAYVRSTIAGALKKKLGLEVTSDEELGRAYRLPGP